MTAISIGRNVMNEVPPDFQFQGLLGYRMLYRVSRPDDPDDPASVIWSSPVMHCQLWKPGIVHEAKCIICHNQRIAIEKVCESPVSFGPECTHKTAGFHAAFDIEYIHRRFDWSAFHSLPSAILLTDFTGYIVIGSAGLRAQFAQVFAVVYDPCYPREVQEEAADYFGTPFISIDMADTLVQLSRERWI